MANFFSKLAEKLFERENNRAQVFEMTFLFGRLNNHNFSATRIVVAAFSFLCGVTGIIAGYYEILQGNVAPDGLIISTIGPQNSIWKTYELSDLMETYSALTIIPNYLVTGILAIIMSSLVIVWGARYIHGKHGVVIFFLLSLMQLLVGGSFVLDLALITTLVATQINKPLNWWKKHIPSKAKEALAKTWVWSLSAYLIISIIMLGITFFGVNNESIHGLLDIMAGLMFAPLLLMIIGGFAVDIQRMKK